MKWRLLVVFAMVAGAAACADILGIDDGVPRASDGSLDDGAPDSMPDVGPLDAAGDGPFSPLSCGAATCNFAAGEACCRTGPTTYVCVASAAACTGTFIPCDRPSQCSPTEAGASTCCTTDVLDDGGNYVAQSVACAPYKSCSGAPAHYILCGDGDAGADCPPEAGCAESTGTLPPFLVCK